jgi:hypothetical protein
MVSQELRPWVKWLTLITGHLGALGRAGLFLLVSVLMWRALDGNDTPDPTAKEKNTIGRAFTQLQASARLQPMAPLAVEASL